MHDAVVRLKHRNVLADAGVAVEVALRVREQRAPRAQVAPAKVRRTDENLLRTLHDGVVHGNLLTFRESLVDGALLLGRTVERVHSLENLAHRGLIDAEGIHDGRNAPNEDAGVPEIVVLLDVGLRRLQIGLFAKRIHTVNLAVARRMGTQVGLNVAVARFGAVGLHAERHDGVALGRKAQTRANNALKLLFVGHDVVARRDDDIRLRMLRLDAPAGVCNARSRVSAARLQQDVALGHFGQLLLHKRGVLPVGQHPHVFGRADAAKALHRHLKQRASRAEHVDELFRPFCGAHRPESAPHPASHNHQMIICQHSLSTFDKRKLPCKISENIQHREKNRKKNKKRAENHSISALSIRFDPTFKPAKSCCSHP